MPSISQKNVSAGTANAVEGLKFSKIPAGGALLTLYGSTATAGGNLDVSVDQEDFAKALALNTEQNADEVNTDFDLVMDREPLPPGDLFIAVNDQICNFVAILEYL